MNNEESSKAPKNQSILNNKNDSHIHKKISDRNISPNN